MLILCHNSINHNYLHKACLAKWIETKGTCPCCRAAVQMLDRTDVDYMHLVGDMLTAYEEEDLGPAVASLTRFDASTPAFLELSKALCESVCHVRSGTHVQGLAFFTGESEAFTVASALCGLFPRPLVAVGYRGIEVLYLDIAAPAACPAHNIAKVTSTGIVEPSQQLPVSRKKLSEGDNVFCVTPDTAYPGFVTPTGDVELVLPDDVSPESIAGAPLITFAGSRNTAHVAGVFTGGVVDAWFTDPRPDCWADHHRMVVWMHEWAALEADECAEMWTDYELSGVIWVMGKLPARKNKKLRRKNKHKTKEADGGGGAGAGGGGADDGDGDGAGTGGGGADDGDSDGDDGNDGEG